MGLILFILNLIKDLCIFEFNFCYNMYLFNLLNFKNVNGKYLNCNGFF